MAISGIFKTMFDVAKRTRGRFTGPWIEAIRNKTVALGLLILLHLVSCNLVFFKLVQFFWFIP